MKKTLRSTVNGVNRIYDTDDPEWPFFIETPLGDYHSNELIGALAVADVGGNIRATKVKLELIEEDGFMTVHRCGPWRIERQPNGAYHITHTRTGEWADVGFGLTNVRCWLADEGGEEVAEA